MREDPPPSTTTEAPGATEITIGAEAVPEFFTVTLSGYVPVFTRTVCPATAAWAAALIVQ